MARDLNCTIKAISMIFINVENFLIKGLLPKYINVRNKKDFKLTSMQLKLLIKQELNLNIINNL